MQIPKEQVLEQLRARGDTEQVEQAANELPDTVDTDANADLLAKFEINVEDLLGGAGGLLS